MAIMGQVALVTSFSLVFSIFDLTLDIKNPCYATGSSPHDILTYFAGRTDQL